MQLLGTLRQMPGQGLGRTLSSGRIGEGIDQHPGCPPGLPLARVKGEVWIELPSKDDRLKTINRGFAIEVEVDSSVKQVLLTSPEKTARPYLEKLP